MIWSAAVPATFAPRAERRLSAGNEHSVDILYRLSHVEEQVHALLVF